MEHLAGLNLPIDGRRVFEAAAGIGDLTHFFLDRNCDVTCSDGREENVLYLKDRYPNLDVHKIDFEEKLTIDEEFDIIFCYGLLYHLKNPRMILEEFANTKAPLLLLETCVSPGDELNIFPTQESLDDPTQALSGEACRPTRNWIMHQLKELFEFAYTPISQPCHEEFPIDWKVVAETPQERQRAIFIASRTKLENKLLTENLLERQTYSPKLVT